MPTHDELMEMVSRCVHQKSQEPFPYRMAVAIADLISSQAARIAELEAARDEALAENQHWHDLGVFIGPTGHEEAWKARTEKAEASAKEWQEHHDRKDHRCFELAQRAEKLEAALRKAEPYIRMYHTDTYSGADDLAAVDDALKPDTGEKP